MNLNHNLPARSQKGSLVTFLLVLGIIGLTLITGVISLEVLIRWVSLGRIQHAAEAAGMTYARGMHRLRHNQMSEHGVQAIDYTYAGLYSPSTSTPVNGKLASIPGALSLEYTEASQVLLSNIWSKRITDSSAVNDVRQHQCYKPHGESRFSKNKMSPPNNCEAEGKVSSPIMSLRWAYESSAYGYGVCCALGGNEEADKNKDFCVNVNVSGRMDPIMAGGLPFLHNIDFIKTGNFNINARVVVMKMAVGKSISSSEDITVERVPKDNNNCPVNSPGIPKQSFTPQQIAALRTQGLYHEEFGFLCDNIAILYNCDPEELASLKENNTLKDIINNIESTLTSPPNNSSPSSGASSSSSSGAGSNNPISTKIEGTDPSKEPICLDKNFNEGFYLTQYPEVVAAIKRGEFTSGADHFMKVGRAEGRVANACCLITGKCSEVSVGGSSNDKCGKPCSQISDCAESSDGCSTCSGGRCSSNNKCGKPCSQNTECGGASDGCSTCSGGKCSNSNTPPVGACPPNTVWVYGSGSGSGAGNGSGGGNNCQWDVNNEVPEGSNPQMGFCNDYAKNNTIGGPQIDGSGCSQSLASCLGYQQSNPSIGQATKKLYRCKCGSGELKWDYQGEVALSNGSPACPTGNIGGTACTQKDARCKRTGTSSNTASLFICGSSTKGCVLDFQNRVPATESHPTCSQQGDTIDNSDCSAMGDGKNCASSVISQPSNSQYFRRIFRCNCDKSSSGSGGTGSSGTGSGSTITSSGGSCQPTGSSVSGSGSSSASAGSSSATAGCFWDVNNEVPNGSNTQMAFCNSFARNDFAGGPQIAGSPCGKQLDSCLGYKQTNPLFGQKSSSTKKLFRCNCGYGDLRWTYQGEVDMNANYSSCPDGSIGGSECQIENNRCKRPLNPGQKTGSSNLFICSKSSNKCVLDFQNRIPSDENYPVCPQNGDTIDETDCSTQGNGWRCKSSYTTPADGISPQYLRRIFRCNCSNDNGGSSSTIKGIIIPSSPPKPPIPPAPPVPPSIVITPPPPPIPPAPPAPVITTNTISVEQAEFRILSTSDFNAIGAISYEITNGSMSNGRFVVPQGEILEWNGTYWTQSDGQFTQAQLQNKQIAYRNFGDGKPADIIDVKAFNGITYSPTTSLNITTQPSHAGQILGMGCAPGLICTNNPFTAGNDVTKTESGDDKFFISSSEANNPMSINKSWLGGTDLLYGGAGSDEYIYSSVKGETTPHNVIIHDIGGKDDRLVITCSFINFGFSLSPLDTPGTLQIIEAGGDPYMKDLKINLGNIGLPNKYITIIDYFGDPDGNVQGYGYMDIHLLSDLSGPRGFAQISAWARANK